MSSSAIIMAIISLSVTFGGFIACLIIAIKNKTD